MATIILERGDTFDLNQYVTDATTISFQSGQTVPFGLTMSNGIITVPDNASSVATPSTVYVTGTNSFGSTNTSFQAQIVNSAIDIVDRSFQQKPPQWTVTIGGVDISQQVLSVNDISYELDLYDSGEFNASECTVVLDNRLRIFQRNGSFYSDNSINPLTADIVVSGKLGNVNRRMFTGVVWGITENVDDQAVQLVCLVRTQLLTESEVVNFGSQKYNVSLTEDQEGIIGTYALPESVTPAVDESLSATVEGRPLNVVTDNNLRVFGSFDDENVKQTETTVNTEGGFLDVPPVAAIKSPPIYKDLDNYLNEFLAHENVNNRKVTVPEFATGKWYTSVGRVAYNEENSEVQRYAKDWVYDSTNKIFYVLHGSPQKGVQDLLWSWNKETDTWNLEIAFDSDYEMWQLASADYDDFYVMGTEARDDLSIIPVGTYDSSEEETGSPSLVKVWKATRTTGAVSEFLTNNHVYPPTLALHYAVGFPRENANSYRFGNIPDTRGGFAIRNGRLYYRYASETSYGVAEAVLSTGSVSAFFTITPVANLFTNKATCIFHISGDRMYLAFIEGSDGHVGSTPGALKVGYRTFTSSTIQPIWDSSNDSVAEPSWFSRRYHNAGPLELFVHDDTVYLVAQFRFNSAVVDDIYPDIDATEYPFNGNSFAFLSTFNANRRNAFPLTLGEYYCQIAPRSFTVHENQVHFFQGSPIQYKFPPIRPQERVITFDIDDNDWRNQVGLLKRINGNSVEDVGLVWRSRLEDPDNPENQFFGIHGATNSPMISADNVLYMITGYGNYDQIGQEGADINHVFNDAIIQYGQNSQFRVPRINTNERTGYEVLREIALSTNSIFGFDQQKFFWKTRNNREAQLSAALTNSATSLSYDNAIEEFPSSGFIQVDNEVMSYCGKSGTTLSGLVRGFAGSVATAHNDNALILSIDHVINGTGVTSPIRNMSLSDDYTNLRNSIFIDYGEGTSVYHAKDDASIALYGEREHRVNTFLHFTQIDFAEQLGENYLRTFRNLEQIVSFNSDLALFLSVGDIIYLRTQEISAPMRIYRLRHNFQFGETRVTARTITY